MSGNFADSFKSVGDWFSDTMNMTRAVVFGGIVLGMGLIAFYVISSTKKGKGAGEIVGGLHPLNLGKSKMIKRLR